MSKNKKTPRSSIKPSLKKTPRTDPRNSPDSIINKKPVWRISMLDFKGPWGWKNIDKIFIFETILDKLKQYEKMTWSEIEKKRSSRGKQNHLMPTKEICKKARERLKHIKLDDIDCLYSLRFSAKERLWGIRKNEVLNILWWDPNHGVCPVKRRNT